MKIALINPPTTKQKMFGDIAIAGSNAPPLALISLAASIRNSGHEVVIIDALAEQLNAHDVAERVLQTGAEVAGITCLTFNFSAVSQTCKLLKQRIPGITTVAGGVHITSMASVSMQKCQEIDIGVIGEGEVTVCELLDMIERKGDPAAIAGLALRKDGEIRFTPPRAYIKDLDSLPLPAWDLLPRFPKAYNVQLQEIKEIPTTSVITSRGCTAKCIFCDRSTFGNVVRGVSAPYIVRMLQDLKEKHGVSCVNFEDDNFMILKKRLLALCDLLIKADLNISWSCLARVDCVDRPTLEKMKAAGCWMLIYGIETASDRLLKIINKQVKLQDTVRALKMTRAVGIKSKGLLMAGSFGETRETLEETETFLKSAPLDDISLHYFTPLPATESHETVNDYGTLDDNWDRMTLFSPVFIPRSLTEELLRKHVRRCYLSFYLRPRIVLSYLRRISSWAYFCCLIKAFWSFIHYAVGAKIPEIR